MKIGSIYFWHNVLSTEFKDLQVQIYVLNMFSNTLVYMQENRPIFQNFGILSLFSIRYVSFEYWNRHNQELIILYFPVGSIKNIWFYWKMFIHSYICVSTFKIHNTFSLVFVLLVTIIWLVETQRTYLGPSQIYHNTKSKVYHWGFLQ